MFRLWGKIIRENHLIRDMVAEEASEDTRTHKIMHALDTICSEMDLSRPIWLDRNIADFRRHKKTRFDADNFVESIDFDYLEIQILEE